MGCDYEIEYRLGRDNTTVDALSRLHGKLSTITYLHLTWLEAIYLKAHNDPTLSTMWDAVKNGTIYIKGYEEKEGHVWYKGHLVLSPHSLHKEVVIHELHDTPIGGHSSMLRTYKRIASNFYWVGMKWNTQNYVWQCDVCQQSKSDTLTPAGLLEMLPILDRVWEDMSMDFIEGLPTSNGFSIILVVLDRFSKYGHYIALKHPYSAKTITEAFVKEVLWLHSMSWSIMSDRNPTFTSQFSVEYFWLQGFMLCMSSAYHPQTDGQTEVLNHYLETFYTAS